MASNRPEEKIGKNSGETQGPDWPERWGRRIGAVLGPVLLVGAAVWFLWHLSSQAPA